MTFFEYFGVGVITFGVVFYWREIFAVVFLLFATVFYSILTFILFIKALMKWTVTGKFDSWLVLPPF